MKHNHCAPLSERACAVATVPVVPTVPAAPTAPTRRRHCYGANVAMVAAARRQKRPAPELGHCALRGWGLDIYVTVLLPQRCRGRGGGTRAKIWSPSSLRHHRQVRPPRAAYLARRSSCFSSSPLCRYGTTRTASKRYKRLSGRT